MKILIYTREKGILPALIGFCTHGRGSHAAFLRADGKTVHEAFYPDVHDRPLTEKDRQEAQVFELAGMTRKLHDMFEALFDRNLNEGIKYSITDLIRYALNFPSRDEKHTFCSRYVLNCCHTVFVLWAHWDFMMPLVRLPDGDWASPRDLLISPRLIPSSF